MFNEESEKARLKGLSTVEVILELSRAAYAHGAAQAEFIANASPEALETLERSAITQYAAVYTLSYRAQTEAWKLTDEPCSHDADFEFDEYGSPLDPDAVELPVTDAGTGAIVGWSLVEEPLQ